MRKSKADHLSKVMDFIRNGILVIHQLFFSFAYIFNAK